MKEVWNRIKKWIEENEPKLLDLLNDATTIDELITLEESIGRTFPEEFGEFYLIHNGQKSDGDYLMNGEELLSIERMTSEWEIWANALDEGVFEAGVSHKSEPENGIKKNWWNKYWIPITQDGNGNNTCIDLDPSFKGRKGQIIKIWHDSPERELKSNSFKEWIEMYAKKLEDREYYYSEEWGGIIDKDRIC